MSIKEYLNKLWHVQKEQKKKWDRSCIVSKFSNENRYKIGYVSGMTIV